MTNDASRQDVAIVVGAESALGAAIAKRLSGRCPGVVLACRGGGAPGHLLQELRNRGCRVLQVTGNLGGDELARLVVDQATAEFGTLVALVNVLPQLPSRRMLDSEAGSWDEVIDIAVRSLYAFARPVAQAMRSAGAGGRIVTVSYRAWLGEAEEVALSAAAGAVAGFTRALSLEVGRFGVNVNAVACAYVDTPELRSAEPGQIERAERATALRRAGRPEEVAAVVDFLTGAEATFVTGQVIGVCGGSSVGKATY